jgi:hypothetical protein
MNELENMKDNEKVFKPIGISSNPRKNVPSQRKNLINK